MERTPDARDATVIGKECHIVARKDDDPTTARSPCLLSAEERIEYADLIANRHSYANLVLMCGVHSDLIDDPAQGYSVAAVLEMKRAHEAAVDRESDEALARRVGPEQRALDSEPVASPRPLILYDVPGWQRKAVRQLAEVDPEELRWLSEQVGDPSAPDEERLVELIRSWPDQLRTGSIHLLYVVVRLAEARGRWGLAADAWERIARRAEAPKRADYLVRAAIDAGVGGDEPRRRALLEEAGEIDPSCPRLIVERLDPGQDPSKQLEVLDGVTTEDRSLASLISIQRALNTMLLEDLGGAERHLEVAAELDPESVQVKTMSVNLRVQKARVALRDDRAFSLAEVRAAQDDALKLRDELISMGRWEESGRLLMLAAEVPALLRDPKRAQKLLERALPEELAAPAGAEVMGDAALRAASDELALRLTEGAPSSPGIRRIRATASVASPRKRSAALEELRGLALDGGPEAALAAFARLSACLPPIRAEWDDDVAAVLELAHPRQTLGVRVMAVATSGDTYGAQTIADSLPAEAWAAELRLRVAGVRGNYEALKSAALEFLDFHPDAAGRLLIGTALVQAGAFERATEVLAGIAHDENAPPLVRADAFNELLRTLASQDAWPRAIREWGAWQELSHNVLDEADGRVSAWQVRVARHL